jgi:hypothetical protein
MPALSFGDSIRARRVLGKRDNHDRWADEKIRLRLAALQAVPSAQVLDLYAGGGEMWRRAWRRADDYLGVEMSLRKVMQHPAGRVLHWEAERALATLDLAPWTVFDLDPYGSPWPAARVLARRRLAPGERIAIVLTDGSVRRAMIGKVEQRLADLADEPTWQTGAHWRWGAICRAALERLAERMGGRVAEMDESRIHHQRWGIWHGMAVIEGLPSAARQCGQTIN